MGDTKGAEMQLRSLIELLEAKLAKTEDRNDQAEIKRGMGQALWQLSLVYERTGEKTLAIEALTQAMPLDKALYLRERAAAYGRFAMYKEAIADLDQAIADKEEMEARFKDRPPDMPHDMSLQSARADIYYNAGEYQKALAEFRECLRLDPRNKTYYEKQIERVSQKIEKPN
jgi:tetratricopeptide (TPR) repeat protein